VRVGLVRSCARAARRNIVAIRRGGGGSRRSAGLRKEAKALGLDVPAKVLVLAYEVIE